jgi:predicted ATPase
MSTQRLELVVEFDHARIAIEIDQHCTAVLGIAKAFHLRHDHLILPGHQGPRERLCLVFLSLVLQYKDLVRQCAILRIIAKILSISPQLVSGCAPAPV